MPDFTASMDVRTKDMTMKNVNAPHKIAVSMTRQSEMVKKFLQT
jgi:hypothetical protein